MRSFAPLILAALASAVTAQSGAAPSSFPSGGPGPRPSGAALQSGGFGGFGSQGSAPQGTGFGSGSKPTGAPPSMKTPSLTKRQEPSSLDSAFPTGFPTGFPGSGAAFPSGGFGQGFASGFRPSGAAVQSGGPGSFGSQPPPAGTGFVGSKPSGVPSSVAKRQEPSSLPTGLPASGAAFPSKGFGGKGFAKASGHAHGSGHRSGGSKPTNAPSGTGFGGSKPTDSPSSLAKRQEPSSLASAFPSGQFSQLPGSGRPGPTGGFAKGSGRGFAQASGQAGALPTIPIPSSGLPLIPTGVPSGAAFPSSGFLTKARPTTSA